MIRNVLMRMIIYAVRRMRLAGHAVRVNSRSHQINYYPVVPGQQCLVLTWLPDISFGDDSISFEISVCLVANS